MNSEADGDTDVPSDSKKKRKASEKTSKRKRDDSVDDEEAKSQKGDASGEEASA